MLEGKRVRLRPKRLGDALQDYTWNRDRELARLDGSLPPSIAFKDYVEAYALELKSPLPRRERFAIETLEGVHIGNCMYYDLDREKGEAEVGILIGDRKYWNQGYGTEAMDLLLGLLFNSTSVKKVRLHTLGWNYRAQRAFKKCGFTPASRAPRQGQPFLLMALSRDDWERKCRTV